MGCGGELLAVHFVSTISSSPIVPNIIYHSSSPIEPLVFGPKPSHPTNQTHFLHVAGFIQHNITCADSKCVLFKKVDMSTFEVF